MKARERTSPQKSAHEEYDLVILGGARGSTIAAWTFAGQGKRVAVIERKYTGGSCPNIACLPSKNVIHSTNVASYFRRSEEFVRRPGSGSGWTRRSSQSVPAAQADSTGR